MSPATALPRREIRRTGVHLTTLGFGAAPVAGLYHTVDEQTARAAIDAAWQGGIRYLDTAPHYGLGLSERRVTSDPAVIRMVEELIEAGKVKHFGMSEAAAEVADTPKPPNG
jgi:aryl-alcohol dehydrogenase-like predicted oxidoreductase